MKKKPTKKEPLVFTPEIRAFFRERELKRIERYKKEILELRQDNANWRYRCGEKISELTILKNKINKFYTEVFK